MTKIETNQGAHVYTTLTLLQIIVKNVKYQNLVGDNIQKLLKFPD